MITDKAVGQTQKKLTRFLSTLEARFFRPVDTVDMQFYQTQQVLHAIPSQENFGPLPETWGGEGAYGWFRGSYTVPAELDGQALFLRPLTDGYEATLWVNGCVHSNYARKEIVGSHGNHYCNRIRAKAEAGERIELALEYYAYHRMPGTQPLQYEAQDSFVYRVGDVQVCLRDEAVFDYYFDLRTLLELCQAPSTPAFRRADVEYTLCQVHEGLYYDPATCTQEQFYEGLRRTAPLLKAQLSKKNGGTTPFVGLVGHSHMDTAWLWPICETVKKCARTYANTLNLMEEYPEYRFVQSSAYHSAMIERNYPELFERIRAAVKEGRYEPNGGVWVECDCNLTGGEYMVRQFVWGQRYTRSRFGYTADAFWLPDTFGYSYSIPQIMKGCGVQYFLTTKMTWNDTNLFPYTSFYWQGLDGTRVLTHLNRTHIGPSPLTLDEITQGDNPIYENRCSDRRLFSYGKGDGGGGPEFEMLEMARRVADLEGVPRSGHESVSQFMHELEAGIRKPTTYAGELYLELHRGTLTNQHPIKRNNRKLEFALHNLELATVLRAVQQGVPADERHIAPLMETLLVNQFHDILPGSSIHRVHAESIAATGAAIRDANAQTLALLGDGGDGIVLHNMNGFDWREEQTVYLPAQQATGFKGARMQAVTGKNGEKLVAVSGLRIPAFGSTALEADEAVQPPSPFRVQGGTIETPFAVVTLDENGAFSSFIDKRTGRELVGGLPFNTFLMGEDLSAAWDNWDIDADLEDKLQPVRGLQSLEVVSEGAVELRIRMVHRLSALSTLTQDVIFSAASPLVVFDTVIDWQEGHRFLKTAFDTSLVCDGVLNEIQFGHIRRSNHRSNDQEKARFEVCNHKYTDLTERNNGLALLNDCKYGLSVNEGSLRLSLHKGGLLPDEVGDKGVHEMKYAILPHVGGFSAENVVQPAYAFNNPPIAAAGRCGTQALVRVDAPEVVIETVKPCEDAQNAYILRLYESTGGYASARLHFGHAVRGLVLTNMLEDELQPLDPAAPLTFHPFEIKTIKVLYGEATK